jgi:prevent-host-death family protein
MGRIGRHDSMTTLTIDEAQAQLPELIHKLMPGDELVITENSQPVAKVIPVSAEKPRPMPGRAKGMLTILKDDDEHLKDFEEYMP